MTPTPQVAPVPKTDLSCFNPYIEKFERRLDQSVFAKIRNFVHFSNNVMTYQDQANDKPPQIRNGMELIFNVFEDISRIAIYWKSNSIEEQLMPLCDQYVFLENKLSQLTKVFELADSQRKKALQHKQKGLRILEELVDNLDDCIAKSMEFKKKFQSLIEDIRITLHKINLHASMLEKIFNELATQRTKNIILKSAIGLGIGVMAIGAVATAGAGLVAAGIVGTGLAVSETGIAVTCATGIGIEAIGASGAITATGILCRENSYSIIDNNGPDEIKDILDVQGLRNALKLKKITSEYFMQNLQTFIEVGEVLQKIRTNLGIDECFLRETKNFLSKQITLLKKDVDFVTKKQAISSIYIRHFRSFEKLYNPVGTCLKTYRLTLARSTHNVITQAPKDIPDFLRAQ